MQRHSDHLDTSCLKSLGSVARFVRKEDEGLPAALLKWTGELQCPIVRTPKDGVVYDEHQSLHALIASSIRQCRQIMSECEKPDSRSL
jgi:hypothetical protein